MPTRVQETHAGFTTATVTPTWGTAPTVGNLLRLVVQVGRGTSVACSVSTAGWSAGASGTHTTGTSVLGLFEFFRIADGTANDTPSISVTSATSIYELQEWSGFTSTPHDANGTLVFVDGTSGTISNVSAVANSASEFVFSSAAARTNNSGATMTWGNGFSADLSTFIFTGTTQYALTTGTMNAPTAGTYTGSVALAGAGGTSPSMIAIASTWILSSVTHSGTATIAATTSVADTASVTALPSAAVAATASLASSAVLETLAARAVTRQNMVNNPNLESGTTTNFTAVGATLAADNTSAFAGTYSLKITGTGAAASPYIGFFPVTPGLSYAAQCRVNVPSGLSTAAYVGSIYWYTAANVLLSVVTGLLVPAGTTKSWALASAVGTAPATAAKALVVFCNGQTLQNTDNIWVDQILFEQAGSVQSYFDGSTAASGVNSYVWSGSANLSASVQYTDLLPITSTVSLDISTIPEYFAVANPAAVASVSDDAVVTTLPAVAIAAAGSLADDAVVIELPAAAITSVASVSDTALITALPSAPITSTVAVSDDALISALPTVAITSAASVVDDALVTALPAVSITSVASVAETFFVTQSFSAAIAATTTVSDTALVTELPSVAIASTASMTEVAAIEVLAAAALAPLVSMTVSGFGTTGAAVDIATAASLSTVADATVLAAIPIASLVSLQATGDVTEPGVVDITVLASVFAAGDGVGHQFGNAAITAASSVNAAQAITTFPLVLAASSVGVSAGASVTTLAAALITSIASMIASGQVSGTDGAVITSTVSLGLGESVTTLPSASIASMASLGVGVLGQVLVSVVAASRVALDVGGVEVAKTGSVLVASRAQLAIAVDALLLPVVVVTPVAQVSAAATIFESSRPNLAWNGTEWKISLFWIWDGAAWA